MIFAIRNSVPTARLKPKAGHKPRLVEFFAGVARLPEGFHLTGNVKNGKMAQIPKFTPGRKQPYWEPDSQNPNLIRLVCSVGHSLAVDRKYISKSGEVEETIPIMNSCEGSIRCPRIFCAMHCQHIILKDYEPTI
jgi:hypothetical protein